MTPGKSDRWIARLLLAAMLFAQASIAFAGCPIDRGGLAHALATDAANECGSAMTSATEYGPLSANRCLAHCTADLQIPAVPVAIVRSAADVPVLLLPRAGNIAQRQSGLEFPPPGTRPPRILLHSFLI